MKHRIDPKVDCVFKSILGKEENKNLLIHFLNAVLEPEVSIRDVSILNPYNEKEFIGDKLTVVDVKALDERGNSYQIEIQMAVHAALTSRVLFTWSSIYHSQMKDGDTYLKLCPVISVWLVDGNLFPDTDDCHLRFQIYDSAHSLSLTDHLKIHILQLPKWKQKKRAGTEKDRWIYLFREGKNADTDSLPEILDTEEMRQVMNVLRNFSENQRNYLLYQSRLEAVYERNTWLHQLEEARKMVALAEEKAEKQRRQAEKHRKQIRQAEKEKQRVEKEKQQAEKEKQQVEKEKQQAERKAAQTEEKFRRLQSLLKEKGIEIEDEKQK
ncbi:MAG: Rpn family recombination-promoting nuclease/putative transposase [Desulfococcaceae bacterium]